MNFSEKYYSIYDLVKQEIDEVKSVVISQISSVSELKSELTSYLKLPSKHVRAVLAFLYLKANNIDIDIKQIKYQAIIELIHNASLIHDDIIDDSDSRRGKESMNYELGNHLSVIGGDLLLSVSLKMMAELNNNDILKKLTETFMNMCYGEISQHNDKFKIPTEEAYLKKTYNKTASLFECTLSGAMMLAGGDAVLSADFSKNFGMAFQIRDDIKNIVESDFSNDIKNGIYTAPVIYSQNSQAPYEGIEKAKVLLNNYLSEAGRAISVLPDNEYRAGLKELLELLNE